MKSTSPKKSVNCSVERNNRKMLPENSGRDLRVKKVSFADVSVIVIKDDKHFSLRTPAEGEKELLTPKERRRRKAVLAVVCTTSILLTASALFVLITLFHASAIDEAVRRENENSLLTLTSSSGDFLNNTITDLAASTIVQELTLNPHNFTLNKIT